MKNRATCPHCKYRSPTIRNDFGVTILLDFAAAKAQGIKNVKPSKKKNNKDEEEEDVKDLIGGDDDDVDIFDDIDNLKTEVKTQSTLNIGNTRDNLTLQLQQVRTGKVDKLAWRALEVRDHFRLLWEHEKEHLKRMYPIFNMVKTNGSQACPMDVLFMETILVNPSKFRPIRVFAGSKYESSSTVIYRRILEADQLLSMVKMSMKSKKEFMNVKELLEQRVSGKTLNEKLYNAYVLLQQATNNLYDREANPASRGSGEKGLKQILEKKEVS